MIALLITDLTLAGEDETSARAAAVLGSLRDGSAVSFGVRDHACPARRRVALARALVALARPRGARVIVHDRVDLALAADADGVQLGERSIGAEEARALLGASAYVGRSCHDAAGLVAAAREGVDAATLSPLFASPGKGAPLGAARFADARAAVPSLPVLALGGVDAANAIEAARAGASGAATIRGWLVGDDPAGAVRAMVRAFAPADQSATPTRR